MMKLVNVRVHKEPVIGTHVISVSTTVTVEVTNGANHSKTHYSHFDYRRAVFAIRVVVSKASGDRPKHNHDNVYVCCGFGNVSFFFIVFKSI